MRIDTPDLEVKYRPQSLDEIVGQEHIVTALEGFFRKGKKAIPHKFLFAGPKGLGKTTFARIIATELECDPSTNLIEVDGATYTGVADARSLKETLVYAAVGENPIKFVILDECHRLSAQAWDALLKIIEEPPKHLYWALCTTELNKVPATIQSRCRPFNLKEIPNKALEKLVVMVAKEEGIKIPEDAVDVIVHEARGCARNAIVYLSLCSQVENEEEARKVLESAYGTVEVIELSRLLANRKLNWAKATSIIKNLKETSPESIRIQIANYIAAVLLNTGEKEAPRLLNVLSNFSKPLYQATGNADLILAVAGCVFDTEEE